MEKKSITEHFKGIVEGCMYDFHEQMGRLEASLEFAEKVGVDDNIISMIHNASRGMSSNLGTCLIWGNDVTVTHYQGAIRLLEKARDLLKGDIHAYYEQVRIDDLVSLVAQKHPELNRYVRAA